MKYFLSRKGVPTQRMAGKPGADHIEIARATEQLDSNGDVYDQMFKLGFIRVQETAQVILVDGPRPLTPAQRRFLDARKSEGKEVKINNSAFIESRG